jgi:hypothetical protein
VSLSPVWLPGTVRPIWQASDYPVTAYTGLKYVFNSQSNYQQPTLLCDSSPGVFLSHSLCLWGTLSGFLSSSFLPTLLKYPAVGAGPNIHADGKRLIFRQTDNLVLRLPIWLMEFLMESSTFLQCVLTSFFSFCFFPNILSTIFYIWNRFFLLTVNLHT